VTFPPGHPTVAEIEAKLHGRIPRRLPVGDLRPSAVMALIKDGPDGAEVLLTERSHNVQDHKGQVSLPGGSTDPGDLDELATAIRESEEEVGLVPSNIRVLGRTDDFVTNTGFHITPWVAAIETFDGLQPMTGEIDECFSFPLAWMLDEDRVSRIPWEYKGRVHEVLVVHCQGHILWGATARILYDLMEIVAK
jgi:8-oxo-dGTP pyrophosphatase MutT (NUDIX family)